MKTVKFVMPMLAFLFAIAAAFATELKKGDSSVEEYFLRIEDEEQPCVQCDPSSVNDNPAVQCNATPSTTMCFCDTGQSAADQLHRGSPTICEPLWKISRP